MTATDPAAAIVAKLEAGGYSPRPTGPDAWESRCPAHDGRRRNLSVKRGDDGRILVHCHHQPGCAPAAILAALGMTLSDLFNWAQDSVYATLRTRNLSSVPLLTRNLQASYTRMLIKLANTPPKGTPYDAQALARAKLVSLSGTLRGALNSGSLDEISRAHLEDLQAKVSIALEGRPVLGL